MTAQQPQPQRQPAPPSDDSAPTSFASTPSGAARAYQTGRDQSIHEHHHYAPPAPPTPASPPTPSPPPRRPWRTALPWVIASAVVLVFAAAAGPELWQKHMLDPGAAGTTDVAHSADPRSSPTKQSPTPSRSPSTPAAQTQPAPQREPAPAPANPSTVPSSAPSLTPAVGLPPNPAGDRCGPWRTPPVPRTEVRACARIDGDRLYMIGEWRATSGPAFLVDVHLWLEDSTGKSVVYPEGPSAKSFPAMRVDPGGSEKNQQWKEWEVRADLVRGTTYEVSLSVLPNGSAGPDIRSPGVTGFQYGIKY